MEDPASGVEEVLLGKMRALARRGAQLRRQADGAGLIEPGRPHRPPQRICATEFELLIEEGWIRDAGGDGFVLSRRGAAALRSLLNRSAMVAREAADGGEAEAAAGSMQAAHGGRRPSVEKPRLNQRESPLAWLAQRRDKEGRPLISSVELEAGERLRLDFERALLGPRVTASWSPTAAADRPARGAPGTGLELSEAAVAARQRVEAALKAVGPTLSGVLLDVCCFLKGLEQAERNGGWPRRAGKSLLQAGLELLAIHYGLARRGDVIGRIRSWATADFRPAMDGLAGSIEEV